jgi:hypothetical protein
MPRYFFHLEGREERIADRRGQILTDEAAALREANLDRTSPIEIHKALDLMKFPENG